MNLNALSLPELKVKHGRLLSAAVRVWAEIQKREGTERIEQQIACLPTKQRDFVLALCDARGRTVEIMELEEKVWAGKEQTTDYLRAFVNRIGKTFDKEHLPFFIESVVQKNGDLRGYKIKKTKKQK